MNELSIDRLRDEVDKGNKAAHAMNNFIAPYIASKRITLYENFCIASISDPEVLLEIKRMHSILDDIEDEINSVINTGKMATKSLDSQQS